MLNHDFQPAFQQKIGPFKTQSGWLFTVAEIGDLWFLKWRSPFGNLGMSIFSNEEDIVQVIKEINNYRPANFN